MKKITVIASFMSSVLIIALIIGLLGCRPTLETASVPLQGVEVREYQGEDLSSILEQPDNSIKGPQYIDINSYRLQITGLVQNSANYTYDEVVKGFTDYKKVVKLDCVEGWSVNILWEGVQVRDMLVKAGVLSEAKVVIFHAYDGYTTSFPIEYIMDNPILMAYKVNDTTLPPEKGYPFQLVAESKWGYKWAKWITQIELSDDINYKGYWEERGYSSSGDLDKGIFER